ncbi:hypothetical protein PAXRUDRAFT_374828 [Paxillus rubicundulus Ve08.2h10]|uniref:phosphatidylinositol-3,4,5-trisphosphate 3-phosphatase n=1 Tax=Paxillus rubicundulus Ve08.2h10 TaxID=930991 RepID=A0A0D0E3P1_9AGAM|nr:hypothetical protein PAXRUDRAFT_374828 [Paxillus rubicundulus Ve08.2h10]
MSLYLRRLVSGNKARFKDHELDLELDLAYLTDQIIVMGFPAIGVESIYRNHRADVQRFLSTRHGSDFWVFNFCPLTENAYHESVFQGRVSRYPFPDHHVPPFSFLSLVTREIHAWLSGSKARVAVLHCKAGKGRSGTLACAYLLSLYLAPSKSMSSSFHSHGSNEWSILGAKEGLPTPSSEGKGSAELQFDAEVREMGPCPSTSDRRLAGTPSVHSNAELARVSSESSMTTLEQVLDLHRSRRMKISSKRLKRSLSASTAKKPKMGVSIPSQQRWLFYWSQVLQGSDPTSFRLSTGKDFPAEGHETSLNKRNQIQKVRLTELTIRMQGLYGVQPRLVQIASAVATSARKGHDVRSSTAGRVWASLSRYDDRLVEELDHLQRSATNSGGQEVSNIFRNDEWDKGKMVHRFAEMGASGIEPLQEEDIRQPLTHVLRPLSSNKLEGDWVELYGEGVNQSQYEGLHHASTFEGSAYSLMSRPGGDENREEPWGILLEANRELRIKLFMGEIVLGWVWLIPAFHISPDSPTSTLVLTHDDIDFSIGIGKALVDLKVSFSRCDD